MNKINRQAIYHISDIPFAYPKDKDHIHIRLRTAKDDFKKVELLYKDRYDFTYDYKREEMEIESSSDLFTFYSIEVNVLRNRYRYLFKLTDKSNKEYYFDERGIHDILREHPEVMSFQFPYIGEADVYEEHKFLSEAVVYQIFPERFSNGDESNDPEGTEPWGMLPTQRNNFGGDLKGIINHLDYLKELGVTLIYLTPIFESSSNHKYNTRDYYKIDPQFGTLEDAKLLVEKTHELGMKIVFDAVFNHSGSDFFAFEDLIKNGENSKYKDWYHYDSLPIDTQKVNYYTFADYISTMPKFRTENEGVRQYLFEVGKYWVKEIGIDGWRLDVCDEVDHRFWRDFKTELRKVKDDVILIGEIMHESSNFLRGDQLDSIMNYPFKNAMVEFFAKSELNETQFLDILSINRNIYMDPITRQLWNLLGSHDTSRFSTESSLDFRRLKIASFFQFTYIGVPYIYYGDEIGLSGGHDPLCRGCMFFDEKHQNLELLNHFKEMTRLRKSNKTLVYGDFKILYAKDNVIVYSRTYEGNTIILAVNNNDKEMKFQVSLAGVNEKVEMEPFGFKILKEINE